MKTTFSKASTNLSMSAGDRKHHRYSTKIKKKYFDVVRRKLHNDELNDLYCSPDIVRVIKSRRMRWAGIPEGKRPYGRQRRRWEDNIKMDLQEVGCWGMGWIELAQDRDRWWALVNLVMNLRVP